MHIPDVLPVDDGKPFIRIPGRRLVLELNIKKLSGGTVECKLERGRLEKSQQCDDGNVIRPLGVGKGGLV